MDEKNSQIITDPQLPENQNKGERKKGGRPKGISGKSVHYIRECILTSFHQLGGVKWLVQLAQEDPKAYATLLGKAMPNIQSGDSENPVETKSTITIDVSKLPDDILHRLGGAL